MANGDRINTLTNAANTQFFYSQWQESLRASLRAIELSAQVDDPRAELLARYLALTALLQSGAAQDADRHALAMLDLAERTGDRFWLTNAYWVSERVSAFKGDWKAARSFSDRGLSVSPGAATLLLTRTKLEYEVGQF